MKINPLDEKEFFPELKTAFQNLYWPEADSHKGQNGKLLIIGGSELFHAASRWSLDVASRIVDMVFYSSVPKNQTLVLGYFQRKKQEEVAKAAFWDGIVVVEKQLEHYLEEADAVLIGPGMDRSKRTEKISNKLLKKYPEKKWVIDAGALQMIDPQLLHENCIITPHHQEMEILAAKDSRFSLENYQGPGICILKGEEDQILFPNGQVLFIKGGNAGMTKGGTGDVLAGLVAALYCKNDAQTAALVASFINKKAGEELYQQRGVYFNSTDLVEVVSKSLFQAKKAFLQKNNNLKVKQ